MSNSESVALLPESAGEAAQNSNRSRSRKRSAVWQYFEELPNEGKAIAGQNLLITKVLEYLTYRTILGHPAKNFLQILIVIPFFQKVCLVWMFAILY